MILIASILIAVAVALAIVGLAFQRREAKLRALAQRLQGIGDVSAPSEGVSVERDARYSALPWLDRTLRRLSIGERLEMLLYQAGMNLRAGALVLLLAAAAIGGYFLGLMLFHRVFPALVFMSALGAAPYLYVRIRKAQRMAAFRAAFPDSLDLLVSGLRAGLSFSAAMQIVAEESPEPVAGEFAITVEEQALGLDVREAMGNLTRRVDLLDLRFFVTAVLLQRETGGNLAEVLSNSAALIRERFKVMGDIQTFTAQGKLSAGILVALPVIVGLMTYMMAPDYFIPMVAAEAGRKALWFAGFLQLLGMFVIFKIANIKV
ncbi:MAG: hypothetical protein E6K73_13635 [Candidatus Eisenbacteria bacterium]|uniref:Type II secretion system protein GspF domain-containing protein n=1 Tax=Eiseniibacteriota bacterium TaxID=2212470 RepID=A0A538S7S7_UNCEI|nr:MAG: hypothetical protein E6K73_13635 [Candidatus Eisenbacteria bacterium]